MARPGRGAAASLAPAVAAAAIEVAASDAGARMLRLADNVFVIEHDDATDEWPHGNTGVIVGQAGLFVIDSCYLPSRARADIALIRRVTDKPVRFLMTTHWHFDHNNGASAYRDAFPGVTLLAERNTARWIELNQRYWKALSTSPGSARREALASSRIEAVIAKRRAEHAELEALEVVVPTQLFDGRMSLDFEGTQIEIEDRGPANSPNDATVWLPTSASCSPATSWFVRPCPMSVRPGRCTGRRCCASSRPCPPPPSCPATGPP